MPHDFQLTFVVLHKLQEMSYPGVSRSNVL